MSDELKLDNCKLCGSDDIEPTCHDDFEYRDGSAIYCVNCGFSMDSIESWNGLNVPIVDELNERIAELEGYNQSFSESLTESNDTIRGLRKQLAEAKRANLRNDKFIIDGLFLAYLNHDGYGWTLVDGIYRVHNNNNPKNQKNHIFGCNTFTQLIDWLIESIGKKGGLENDGTEAQEVY